jgi:hypothetical protein
MRRKMRRQELEKRRADFELQKENTVRMGSSVSLGVSFSLIDH